MGALSIALRSLLVPGWDYMCMRRKGVRREGGREDGYEEEEEAVGERNR